MEARGEEARLPSNQAEFDAAVIGRIAGMYAGFGRTVLQQFESARAVDRNGSKVGCFTHFAVPEECELLPEATQSPLDGPEIWIRGILSAYDRHSDPTYGMAGSLLFHEGGKIVMLECYAYGESWPEDLYEFEFPSAEQSSDSQ